MPMYSHQECTTEENYFQINYSLLSIQSRTHHQNGTIQKINTTGTKPGMSACISYSSNGKTHEEGFVSNRRYGQEVILSGLYIDVNYHELCL